MPYYRIEFERTFDVDVYAASKEEAETIANNSVDDVDGSWNPPEWTVGWVHQIDKPWEDVLQGVAADWTMVHISDDVPREEREILISDAQEKLDLE